MRPFGAWFGRFAMAGACLLGAGCGGGGDIPDPDSDSRAASDSAPRGPALRRGQEPEPEGSPKPEPVALASNTPAPEAEKAAPRSAEKPAEAEQAAPPLKGDASATDEMLRISGVSAAASASPAPSTPGPGSTPPASAPGFTPSAPGFTPSAPGVGGGPQPVASAPGAQPETPGGGGEARRGRPGQPGASGPMAMAPGPGAGGGPESMPGGPGMPGAPGAPGMPGAPGASGFGAVPGPGGSANQDPALRGTAAFRYPVTSVKAFLAALAAKDKDRLAQTVALHAPTEAAEKHRKIFAAISEGSISDDELDDMAKALTGFQVVQQLPAYSTGKIEVLVSKMDGRDRLQRKITTRKEKEGWKVLDVDSALEFKFIQMPRGRGGRRR